MRLVNLLPRWLTPRVESQPYDPPQDDPTQGHVAENEPSAFREPNPPADLQEARPAAKERYQLIAEALKREAGVRRHYTHKSISGFAWIGSGKILAPCDDTPSRLRTPPRSETCLSPSARPVSLAHRSKQLVPRSHAHPPHPALRPAPAAGATQARQQS